MEILKSALVMYYKSISTIEVTVTSIVLVALLVFIIINLKPKYGVGQHNSGGN